MEEASEGSGSVIGWVWTLALREFEYWLGGVDPRLGSFSGKKIGQFGWREVVEGGVAFPSVALILVRHRLAIL